MSLGTVQSCFFCGRAVMFRELTFGVSFLLVLGLCLCASAQLPAGWTSQDIGGPTAAGSAQYDDATRTWTIRGDGTGVRERADQFHYVYKPLSGDGELVMRVVSIEPAVDEWAMAGVMIRVFLDPGSPYVIMAVTPNGPAQDHGVTYYGRAAPGGAADHESSGAMTPPYWVKISRSGNTFAGFHSPDGVNWTEQWSDDADFVPPNTYIGMAVTSDVEGTLVTAVFDSGPVQARSPEPADGTRHVLAPFVRWAPGATATAHDVYFGTSPTLGPAEHMGRLPLAQTMYFHAPGIAPATTYYWRIDEVGADGTIHTGDVWSFTSAPVTAYAPQPWDGGRGVDLEADLAWTGGIGAVSHDVYFGTDRAAVEAGDPGVFKGNQVTMTYDPGLLVEDTAYYWRIDEHDTGDAVHEGQVWSFRTVGPGDGVMARYFEGMDVSGAPLLTQAEDSINHNWASGEIAGGLSDGISARWTADLEVPFTETYQLITSTDDGVRLWLDGRLLIDDWTNHGVEDNVATVDLVAGHVYRLEMQWYEDGGGAAAQLSWASPSIERQIIPGGPLQLPVRAAAARPANGTVNVSQTLILQWIAGEEAAGHDVYFGDDAQAVANATTASTGVYRGRQALDTTTYDPGPLEWNKTYYWRVDEVNDAHPDSPWPGNVLSFTTADFIVVDDFESYTDDQDAGEAIYQTWIDGVENGTGSYVGYEVAAGGTFGETQIVHAGWQSMPLEYDNSDPPYYSEADRTWNVPQDWTINGADTLVLYVRGRAGNVSEKLYLVVEDSAGRAHVVTHPDDNIALATGWRQWSVPADEFTAAGVNVKAVKKMSIGVGNRSAPTAGGAGQIYIDDIRVIKSVPAP